MRRRVSAPPEEKLVVSQLLDPEVVVKRDGPRCAAWLVAAHRWSLRRDGVKIFKIEVGAQTPTWFLVAVEHLRRRPGWCVVVREARGERTYRVEWLGKRRREVRAWARS